MIPVATLSPAMRFSRTARGKAVGIPAARRAHPIFQFLLGRVRRKRPTALRSRFLRRDCLQKTSRWVWPSCRWRWRTRELGPS